MHLIYLQMASQNTGHIALWGKKDTHGNFKCLLIWEVCVL